MMPHTLVAPGIHAVPTPLPHRPRSVNAYLLDIGGGEYVLVDGGIDSDDAWRALDDAVIAISGAWSRVRLQVVTHMHVDHVGLVERVRAAAGAPLAMGRLDADRLRHARADPEEEARYRGEMLRANGADEALAIWSERSGPTGPSEFHCEIPIAEDAREMDALPGWAILWTPGHTAGHIALYREADGVMITGDTILAGISPTVGINRQRVDPVGDYLASLDRIRSWAPSVVLPGHRHPILDPIVRIEGLREEVAAESRRIADLASSGGATAAEIAAHRYAGRELPPAMRVHAIREIRAHLDHLDAAHGPRPPLA